MCENKIYLNLPQNADKILFAQDLVDYSLRHFLLPSLPSTIEQYRVVIHNAFTLTVSVAVKYLYRRLESENVEEFENIRLHQPLDVNSFMNYVASIEAQYLPGEFDAQKFLHFCVKTTSMAIKFYSNGFDVGALAVQRIASALENFDMSSGGWERMNSIAANYARIYVNLDSPHETESEYESTSCSSCGRFSEASDSVMTPSPGDGPKHVNSRNCAGPALDSISSEEEYSAATSFEVMATEEACEKNGKVIRSAVSYLPLDGNCFKTTNLVGHVPSTTSKNEAKPGGNERSSSSNSVFFDTDEEWDSDVFEDNPDVKEPCDSHGRQLAKKRPASSSSSISGFHVQDSAEKNAAHLTSNSASNPVRHENLSSPQPTCSVETSNVATSPVRKHIAKSRKFF